MTDPCGRAEHPAMPGQHEQRPPSQPGTAHFACGAPVFAGLPLVAFAVAAGFTDRSTAAAVRARPADDLLAAFVGAFLTAAFLLAAVVAAFLAAAFLVTDFFVALVAALVRFAIDCCEGLAVRVDFANNRPRYCPV